MLIQGQPRDYALRVPILGRVWAYGSQSDTLLPRRSHLLVVPFPMGQALNHTSLWVQTSWGYHTRLQKTYPLQLTSEPAPKHCHISNSCDPALNRWSIHNFWSLRMLGDSVEHWVIDSVKEHVSMYQQLSHKFPKLPTAGIINRQGNAHVPR